MGISSFHASSCSCTSPFPASPPSSLPSPTVRSSSPVVEKTDCRERQAQIRYPNPDPSNFVLLVVRVIGKFTVAFVKYPDSTNFEGKKILVYAGNVETGVRAATFLDPHFCPSPEHLSPVARFAPTIEGVRMAQAFCHIASKSTTSCWDHCWRPR